MSRKNTRRIALFALFALVFLAAYLVRIGPDMEDFEVDYRAGQRLRKGEDLYQAQDAHYI